MCESSVDVIDGKGLWIKIRRQSIPAVPHIGRGRIADGFQQVVVTRDVTAVLGWFTPFSAFANRIRQCRFRRQHFFSDCAMRPAVTEAVA